MTDFELDGDLNDEFQEEDGKEVTMDDIDDPELEAIKQRMKEMEAEANKLKDLHTSFDSSTLSKGAASLPTDDEKAEADLRSVYVGQVDYGATAEELEKHFSGCGAINRITILCDKYTGHPKGFAYVEFADKDSVSAAMALDESVFRGRQLKVVPKRTNVPGMVRGRGRGRARPNHLHGVRNYSPYGRPRSRFRRRPYYQSYYPY